MNPSLDLSFLRDPAVRKRIAAVTLVFAAAGVAYALLAPPWYRSTITVVPAKAQRGGALSSMLGGELAGLAAASGVETGAGADSARIAAVLESVAVTDAVIDRFDLRSRYEGKYQETTREALWSHCSVKTLPKPQLVQLSCEDKDPKFVQELLAFFAENGNQVFRRVSVSSASEEVRFLEKRVADLRRLADESATKMREFQEAHHVVDIDAQAKAVVSTLATLNGQRIGKQLELDYARTYSGSDEASLRQLRSQLSVMSGRLHELEAVPEAEAVPNQPPRGRAPAGIFPVALEVPRLRAEYEALYRDRRVAEATLIVALERLEAARANEVRDSSTFLVLDPPTLPTRRSRPKRTATVAVATMIGLACAVAYELWKSGQLRHFLAEGGAAEPIRSAERSDAA